MRKSRLLGAVCVCGTILLIISLPIHAAVIAPGDSLTYNYDFSSDPVSGPFNHASWSLQFTNIYPWLINTSLSLDFFNSVDEHIGSHTLTNPLGSLGGFGSGSGFFGSSDDAVGHLVITSVDATVDINNVWMWLDTPSGESTLQEALVVSTVPVPAAVWLFGSGLLGLVGMARRKAA